MQQKINAYKSKKKNLWINVGEGNEKRKLSCTNAGNVGRHNHDGEENTVSLKNNIQNY